MIPVQQFNFNAQSIVQVFENNAKTPNNASTKLFVYEKILLENSL